MHVSYDSDIADEFRVTTKEGRTILFPVDTRGLYVKESYDEMISWKVLDDKWINFDEGWNRQKLGFWDKHIRSIVYIKS